MVKKAYLKSVFRSFKKNISKIISISVIIFIGIAFVAGLGTVAPTYRNTFNEYLTSAKAPDIIVKSSNMVIPEEDEIFTNIKQSPEIESYDQVVSIDSAALDQLLPPIKEVISKIAPDLVSKIPDHFFGENFPNTRLRSLPTNDISKFTLLEGKLPTLAEEIAIQEPLETMAQYKIGDTIDLGPFFGVKTIVGIVRDPLIFSNYGEPDLVNMEELELIVYFDRNVFQATLPVINLSFSLPTTDLFIKLKNPQKFAFFTDDYNKYVKSVVDNITPTSEESSVICLTLNETKSYALVDAYCDKVSMIAIILPIFFIAVTALVVSTTMNRMIDEDRNIIGCYKTLGFSDTKISAKYLLLGSFCWFLSSLLAMPIGLYIIPYATLPAFKSTFYITELSQSMDPTFGIISAFIMLGFILLVTLTVCYNNLKMQPAELLLPKAPKSGRKIWMEKVPFLWKPLPFRFKSSFRNIFRNRKHFILTVISTAGSTALVFAGFALLELSNGFVDSNLSALTQTIVPIAVLIIIFAVVLCAFVIYNLTNMNIGERSREIATLKVLGYKDSEVVLYIYREVIFMALVGIIFGLPLGVGLIYLVISYLDFGSLSSLTFLTYLYTILIDLGFILFVDLFLVPKIKKVDMISSLKALD